MSVVWGLDAQTDMLKRLGGAHLGFLQMDIVDPFCGVDAWGFYNNRPLNDAKVQDLRAMYHSMGVLACQLDKVIYLPMDPAWFEGPTMQDVTGKYVYQLPLLKLTAAGLAALKAGLFHPCNGNHRRAALLLYYGDLVGALKALRGEAGALAGTELEAKEEEIRVMSLRIERAPFWAIQVYDIGPYLHFPIETRCHIDDDLNARFTKARRPAGTRVHLSLGERVASFIARRRGRHNARMVREVPPSSRLGRENRSAADTGRQHRVGALRRELCGRRQRVQDLGKRS